jgi:hypothetical protein
MAKFKKSRNPNGGSCERGTVQIDIESDSRDALEKMEMLVQKVSMHIKVKNLLS